MACRIELGEFRRREPPAADTRNSGDVIRPKTMTSSLFQEPLHGPIPPVVPCASAMVTGGPPPVTSSFFSFPSAKKPRRRLSGAQKGIPDTPSAISIRGAGLSRSRTQSSPFPSTTPATATRRPSGETAVEGGRPGSNDSLGSGKNSLVTGADSSRRCLHATTPSATDVAASIAARTGQASLDHGGAGLPPRAGSSSRRLASPMSRSRRFGSFCKHSRSSRRTFGGTLSRSGSLVRTSASVSETSSPPNNRSPVSNS